MGDAAVAIGNLSAAEKWLTTAVKLHERLYETNNYALDKPYRRAMLRYMAEIVALAPTAGEQILTQHKEVTARLEFVIQKLDAMARLYHRNRWTDELQRQYDGALREYELLYDQADALGAGLPEHHQEQLL
jgi:hypothetical protein